MLDITGGELLPEVEPANREAIRDEMAGFLDDLSDLAPSGESARVTAIGLLPEAPP